MTIDNEEATSSARAASMAHGATAKGAAYTAVAIAYDDMKKALAALMRGESVDECIQILDECADQIALGRSILNGPTWSLAIAN